MDRVKTLLTYAIWVLLFIVFSEFLINVGLNSSYKEIERKDQIKQVSIYQAEATSSNGRIRGIVTNSQPEDLNGKYVRIDFYSKRNVFLGRKYIEVNNLGQNDSMNFETFFKLQEVGSYEVVITDYKEPEVETEFNINGWTRSDIFIAKIIALLIIM